MSLKIWKKLGEKIVTDTGYWQHRLAQFELPSGQQIDYNYTCSNGSCLVIPIRADGKILMQKQYRPVLDKVRLEFTAGKMEAGETPLEAAVREFSEEAKMSARQFESIGYFEPMGGGSSIIGHFFIAWDLFDQPLASDDNEEFEYYWFTVEEIDGLIERREITDGWALSAWALGRKRVAEIIDQINQKK